MKITNKLKDTNHTFNKDILAFTNPILDKLNFKVHQAKDDNGNTLRTLNQSEPIAIDFRPNTGIIRTKSNAIVKAHNEAIAGHGIINFCIDRPQYKEFYDSLANKTVKDNVLISRGLDLINCTLEGIRQTYNLPSRRGDSSSFNKYIRLDAGIMGYDVPNDGQVLSTSDKSLREYILTNKKLLVKIFKAYAPQEDTSEPRSKTRCKLFCRFFNCVTNDSDNDTKITGKIETFKRGDKEQTWERVNPSIACIHHGQSITTVNPANIPANIRNLNGWNVEDITKFGQVNK